MVKSFEDSTGVNTIPKYLDGISFNANGQLSLIASNLTGRTWDGVIAIFDNAKYAPNVPHMDYGRMNVDGCVDVAWINETKLVVATDAGSVDIWDLKESPLMENTLLLSEHGDICSSVSVSKHTQQLLSGSWDNLIKLWDLEVDLAIHNILIHTDKVLDVQWNHFAASVFASTSEDRTVKVYDNRGSDKPAYLVTQNSIHHPNCLDWISENNLVVGDSNGNLSVYDTRKPKEKLLCVQAHQKGINKVIAGLNDTEIFTAADDTYVKGFNTTELGLIYTDKRHTDYVKGISINPKDNTLWSCAWDGQVLSHSTVVKMEVIENN